MTGTCETYIGSMTFSQRERQMNLIPLVDVRRGGPVAHTRARVAAAAALRELCLAPVPRWSRHVCLSSIDHIAAKWLRSSVSTYGEDLRDVARILGFPGALTLNMSYLFACTTSAARGAERRAAAAPLARLAVRRARPLRRNRLAIRAGGRLLQRHLAGRGRRAERHGAGPLLRGHQPGADAPAHPRTHRASL